MVAERTRRGRAALLTILVTAAAAALAAVVQAGDDVPVPENKAGINSWLNENLRPFGERKGTLDPALAEAEADVLVVKVRKNGSGQFTTINDAIKKSVPPGNTRRVVINIGSGEWREKILINFNQPFVSLVGYSQTDRPTIVYGGTAKQYGTVDSATIIALAPYFVCANLIIKNSSPRPDPYKKDGQALALRINGDKAAFFNSKFLGFQDTLCDDRGYHFFKDCYVEGTVDFIFGRGTSLYLNAEIFVIGDQGLTVITAQGRSKKSENTGYSFVHSKVIGTGKGTSYLGRPWGNMPRVIYAYTEMSSVVQPSGWNDKSFPSGNLYYGEYKNTGEGGSKSSRKFAKELTYDEVKPFLCLAYIKASSWLLPPPKL